MPAKLYHVVCHRAHPRSKEYMINVLSEKFPDAMLVDLENIPVQTQKLILLYPDTIGLGWYKIEKKLLPKIKNLMILNGRKRLFVFTLGVGYKLAMKRFLELSFLPEIIFLPFLLALGLILALKDKLMGHS